MAKDFRGILDPGLGSITSSSLCKIEQTIYHCTEEIINNLRILELSQESLYSDSVYLYEGVS